MSSLSFSVHCTDASWLFLPISSSEQSEITWNCRAGTFFFFLPFPNWPLRSFCAYPNFSKCVMQLAKSITTGTYDLEQKVRIRIEVSKSPARTRTHFQRMSSSGMLAGWLAGWQTLWVAIRSQSQRLAGLGQVMQFLYLNWNMKMLLGLQADDLQLWKGENTKRGWNRLLMYCLF